jgi:hypothetical protein
MHASASFPRAIAPCKLAFLSKISLFRSNDNIILSFTPAGISAGPLLQYHSTLGYP